MAKGAILNKVAENHKNLSILSNLHVNDEASFSCLFCVFTFN